MATLQSQGFNLSSLPVAPRLDFGPMVYGDRLAAGLQRALGSLYDEQQRLAGEAKQGREKARLESLESAIAGVALAETEEAQAAALEGLDDPLKNIALSSGLRLKKQNKLEGLKLRGAELDVAAAEETQMIRTLADALASADDVEDFVGTLSPEQRMLLPQASAFNRQKQIANLEESVRLRKLFNDLEAPVESKQVFPSPQAAEMTFGRKVKTKPVEGGVVVTEIDDEDLAAEIDSAFPYTIDKAEMPFFTSAARAGIFPSEGEKKKDFMERVKGEVRQFNERLDPIARLLFGGGVEAPRNVTPSDPNRRVISFDEIISE